MTGTVVHLIPADMLTNTWHGSYKDIISRVRFFQSRDAYRQVLLHADDPGEVKEAVSDIVDAVFLIEYSKFPRILRWLRLRYPTALIAVRAINLEPLQHLDNVGWWPKKGPLWTAYGMARIALADIACKRYASAIYSINEWENGVYWNRLPGKARIEWLPYHCPDHLLPATRSDNATAKKRIVCLPTSQKNRKSLDLVLRFFRFAEAVERLQPGAHEFVVTGNLQEWELPKSTVVERVGMVDDLTGLLANTKAVCMLSPLGYGFKTTIGDALAHGCIPLIHPLLARRLPAMLKEAVVPVDSELMESVRMAYELMQTARPQPKLDAMLRERAEQLLVRDFGR